MSVWSKVFTTKAGNPYRNADGSFGSADSHDFVVGEGTGPSEKVIDALADDSPFGFKAQSSGQLEEGAAERRAQRRPVRVSPKIRRGLRQVRESST